MASPSLGKSIKGQDPTVYFSDFSFDFSPHPKTGDITVLQNDDSIKNSIRNLLKTKYGEILFDTSIGCGLNYSLFDNIDEITKYTIQEEIKNTLSVHEPRVSLSSVSTSEDIPSHGIFVTIYYTTINNYTIQTVSVFLERVR